MDELEDGGLFGFCGVLCAFGLGGGVARLLEASDQVEGCVG